MHAHYRSDLPSLCRNPRVEQFTRGTAVAHPLGRPTGVGKSWLACALGHKACREGYSVLYKRAPRLFADLATARGEGRLPRMMATLERTRLLIIDDWGPEPAYGRAAR